MRTKLKGHVSDDSGRELKSKALLEHGTYRDQFLALCARCKDSFEQIQKEVGANIKDYLVATSKGAGVRLKSELWKQVIGTIQKNSPAISQDLDELERTRASSKTSFVSPALKLVAQEKDAISLAVSLAGFDRNAVLADYSVVQGEKVRPFISGLHQVTLREDTMVIHDARTLPGWREIDRHIIGATAFEKDGKRLTVMNVNRMPIEETLGVDLLYYHPAFKSFVLVQYKRMTREGQDKLCYRPKDSSYLKEIQRMRDFKAANPDKCDDSKVSQYRLNPECFYFKLCEEVQFEPYSKDLIHGMYIPLDFWEQLLKSPDVKGKRDGLVLSYETVERYLSNSLFITLLQDSWIGSRGITTAAILDLIREWIGESHSVIFAVEEKDDDGEL